MSFYQKNAAGLVLAVKAQAGARRVAIGPVLAAAPSPGWPRARLKIAVTAPAEDGRANEAIITALATWLDVKPGAITLTAGAAARDKKFFIADAVEVPEV
jgi:uncharacterized protein YggU (UPF0235/DUF167 family)